MLIKRKKEEEGSFYCTLVNSHVFGLIWYSSFPRHETMKNISFSPLGHDTSSS